MSKSTPTPSIEKSIDEKPYLIDVAVLCQAFVPVEISCDNSHVTVLDEIEIPKQTFLEIFYPHMENFGINKSTVGAEKYKPFISFETKTVKGTRFNLLERVISNIESDLGVTRTCFTTSSLIEVSNEFASLKSLADMNCCSVVASLPWSNVETILKTYESYNSKSKIVPTFAVSVGFKTPTPNVKDTVMKLQYKIIVE